MDADGQMTILDMGKMQGVTRGENYPLRKLVDWKKVWGQNKYTFFPWIGSEIYKGLATFPKRKKKIPRNPPNVGPQEKEKQLKT